MQLSKGDTLSSRLVIDAMGNFSPILKQVIYWPKSISNFTFSFALVIVVKILYLQIRFS